MNIYKILLYDGFNSREVIIEGYDVVQAIQNNSMIIVSSILKIELIGSQQKKDYSQQP